ILLPRLVQQNPTQHERQLDRYPLPKFNPSNSGTSYNQRPIVSIRDLLQYNHILPHPPSIQLPQIPLPPNLLVPFITSHAYNYDHPL
ncbi:hypothetical protein, partial [Staphylococcus epidermidis]|uniref:hypothetical protein n=1 Tax=Staphylococcus epidermidis TaxID=1282 RepID=UPI00164305B8